MSRPALATLAGLLLIAAAVSASNMAVTLAIAAGAHAAEAPFEIEIVSPPDTIPLGVARPIYTQRGVVKGWFKIDVLVEARLVGEKAVPIVPAPVPDYYGGREGLFAVYARARDENGVEVPPCKSPGTAEMVVTGEPRLEPGWTQRRRVPVCVPGVGRYVVEGVVEETASSYPNADGKLLKLWTGSVASPAVTIDVTEPEGIDKEAYDAFGGDPLGELGQSWGVLRRFPSSTYAAYFVWDQYAQGAVGVNADSAADSVAQGPIHKNGVVPCDQEGQMSSTNSSILSGTSFVRCRDNWLRLALDNHPDIWFADEMRLRVALDSCLLGDKSGCAAQLHDLAQHGRPYVAAKAGELLAAMQAKGMLEEEAK